MVYVTQRHNYFSYVIIKLTLITLLLHENFKMANGDPYSWKWSYSTIESEHGTMSTVKCIE